MRLAFASGAVCLSLVGVAGQPEPPKNPDPATVAVASTANDDAAKHAKRTACLKEAKAKKLIGAERSAYLKDCIAAPAAAGT